MIVRPTGHCRRRSLVACFLCLLVPLVISGSALGAGKTVRKPKMQKVSLLYTLSAASGTLVPKKGKGEMYTLVLRGLDRNVTWFSDRPSRKSGTFPVRGLPDAWRGFGFAADPPNAALTYTDRSGDSGRTVVVELSHPREARGRLSFSARVLDPGSVKSPNLLERALGADRDPAHALTAASLFIDDAEAPVIAGCVLQPYTRCERTDFPKFTQLEELDLTAANFSGSTMAVVAFDNAKIWDVDLSGVDLEAAELRDQELWSVDLSGANLKYADFQESKFREADLTGATFALSNFYFAELSEAKFDEAALISEAILCATRTPLQYSVSNSNGPYGNIRCFE